MTRPRRSSGIVVPHQPRWHQRLLAWLIFRGIKALAGSVRCDWHDESGLHNGQSTQPAIYCIWHNRLALSMRFYFGFIKPRKNSTGLAAMVSASKDGGLLARILEDFGVQPVRGSSSRRGPQALLELTTWAERGYDLAITPDGPRGPRNVVQEGVTSLAQVTGLPIVPVSCHLQPKITLKSWDRFQIPLPLAKCIVRFGEPLRVPREATDDEREVLRKQLEQRLRELTTD
ncbi:MAG: lysophospholipid acyltransferase family protein [Verrucomicrobia subdivision 3 bacterium]|nr:lysophospholipid acyltransferase family protein [Limisphaerales bacterium]